MRALLSRWGPALAMMVAIFIASSLPKAEVPEFGVWDLVVKKGGHLAGYALLGAAYLRGLTNGGAATRRQMAAAVALAALYGATDEFHQLFVPGRGAAPLDVLIDALGATAGVVIRTWVLRRAGM